MWTDARWIENCNETEVNSKQLKNQVSTIKNQLSYLISATIFIAFSDLIKHNKNVFFDKTSLPMHQILGIFQGFNFQKLV